MNRDGNGTGGTLSKGPCGAGGEAARETPAGDGAMRGGALDERLASLLDHDLPEGDRREVEKMMAAEPGAGRTVAEMRAMREALRKAGPVEAPGGFEDAVIARLREERKRAAVVQLQTRRDRRLVMLQAASLAMLVAAYAALIGTTRIHDVNPRWGSTSTAPLSPRPPGEGGAMPEPGVTADEPTLGSRTARLGRTRPAGPDAARHGSILPRAGTGTSCASTATRTGASPPAS